MKSVIDSEGYRPNVGIILCNTDRQVLWARRAGQDSWQFPQGGIEANESVEDALFRELEEEVGLEPGHVKMIGSTSDWLRYQLPEHLIRYNKQPLCIGQKQIWFMLQLLDTDDKVRFDRCPRPEFDHWTWVDYWYPLKEVIAFKRKVYEQALLELAPCLFEDESLCRIPQEYRVRRQA